MKNTAFSQRAGKASFQAVGTIRASQITFILGPAQGVELSTAAEAGLPLVGRQNGFEGFWPGLKIL